MLFLRKTLATHFQVIVYPLQQDQNDAGGEPVDPERPSRACFVETDREHRDQIIQ